MNSSCKEVSSIQVSVTYRDGSTEVRGFKNANLPMVSPTCQPYVQGRPSGQCHQCHGTGIFSAPPCPESIQDPIPPPNTLKFPVRPVRHCQSLVPMGAPAYVPPNNVLPEKGDEIPNENYFDQDDQDYSIPRMIKQKRIIFEPHEIKTFPQESGYLNAEKIFVNQVCKLHHIGRSHIF